MLVIPSTKFFNLLLLECCVFSYTYASRGSASRKDTLEKNVTEATDRLVREVKHLWPTSGKFHVCWKTWSRNVALKWELYYLSIHIQLAKKEKKGKKKKKKGKKSIKQKRHFVKCNFLM